MYTLILSGRESIQSLSSKAKARLDQMKLDLHPKKEREREKVGFTFLYFTTHGDEC